MREEGLWLEWRREVGSCGISSSNETGLSSQGKLEERPTGGRGRKVIRKLGELQRSLCELVTHNNIQF